MRLALLIYYCSTLIWIFPPVRQYRGNYFYFFLILALSDVITLISHLFFPFSALDIYVFISYFLLLSLYSAGALRKGLPIVTGGLLVLLLIVYFRLILPEWIIVLIHLAILYIFLKTAILLFINSGEINVFHFLLFSYELTVVFKFIFLILEQDSGYLYYCLTTGLEVVFGAAFIVFRDYNRKTPVPLKIKEDI